MYTVLLISTCVINIHTHTLILYKMLFSTDLPLYSGRDTLKLPKHLFGGLLVGEEGRAALEGGEDSLLLLVRL